MHIRTLRLKCLGVLVVESVGAVQVHVQHVALATVVAVDGSTALALTNESSKPIIVTASSSSVVVCLGRSACMFPVALLVRRCMR